MEGLANKLRDSKLGRSCLVFCLFLLLSVVFTYPLAFNFNRHIIEPGPKSKWDTDASKFLFNIYHFKRSISRGTDPFFVKKLYYPDGLNLSRDTLAPLYSLVAAVLSLLGLSMIQANNLLYFLSLALTGLAMFKYVNYMTKDSLASFFSSFTLISSGFILWQYRIGHINLLQAMWMPIIFLCLEKLLEDPKTKNALLLSIFLTVQLLSSLEYTLFALLLIPIYTLLRSKNWRRLKGSLTYFFQSALFFIALASFYLSKLLPSAAVSRNLQQVKSYGLVNLGFDTTLFLLGKVQLVFLIFSSIFLLLKKRKKFLTFLIFGLTAFLLALGPFHPFAPYTVIYRLVPFVAKFRTPVRLILFSLISFSLIIGLFLSRLNKKIKLGVMITAMALIVTQLPSTATLNLDPSQQNSIYSSLSEKRNNFSLAEYPNTYNCQYTYHITIHNKNLVGGCAPYPPPSYHKFVRTCGKYRFKIDNKDCQELIDAYQLKYVIFHSDQYEEWASMREKLLNNDKLELIRKESPLYLFKIV